MILFLIKKTLFSSRNRKLDVGASYALLPIIKYILRVVAIGMVLETVGIKLTVLLAGSAALLVVGGLGLQQTFNDILSGIILLSEKSTKIEDVLEVDGIIVKIQSIG